MSQSGRSSLKQRTSVNQMKVTPLRLLVLETRADYYRTIFFAFAVGLSHLMIGATVMTAFIYSLVSKDVHVGLCTAAYQLFSAQAILSLHYCNGWSAPLRLRKRKAVHIGLQVLAVGGVSFGIGVLTAKQGINGSSAHGITGIVTIFCTIFAVITGPLGILSNENIGVTHMLLGSITFLMSSICLIFGLFTEEFRNWAFNELVYMLTVFIVFYTFVIVSSVLLKSVKRLKRK